jgi:hypothetical protein
MKLIETIVTEKTVRMRYADNEDAAKASQWIDFQVPLDKLEHADQTALGEPELRYLAQVRQAALRYARGVIGDETQRLASLINRRI